MITYTIFSNENPQGTTLAKLADLNQANYMEPYFRQLYSADRFRVTVQYKPRGKHEYFCGGWR